MPPSELMVEPKLLPRYEGADTADTITIERGIIITDMRDKLIRLQEWIKGTYD